MDRRNLPDIDLRHELAALGLECHLLAPLLYFASPGVLPDLGADDAPDFHECLCEELEPLTSLAFPGRTLTTAHVLSEDWAVTLRRIAEPHEVMACTTLAFHALPVSNSLPLSFFHTRFEAVRPDLQRTGLGRLLYQCIEVWARFLILNDTTVLEGIISSGGDFRIVSVIDKDGDDDNDDDDDNDEGHGTFLKKIGFVRAVHNFGQDTSREVAFQRDLHIPVDPTPHPSLAVEGEASAPVAEEAAALTYARCMSESG
jgi:hypothetical protein